MPDSIIPSNPNIPIQPPVQGNVASLANKDTLSNLKNSVSPKTFGDQAQKAGIAAVTTAATQSTLTKLYKEKADLIQEGIQLDINHQKILFELDQKHTPKKQIQNGQTVEIPAELNDNEYQVAIIVENGGTLPNGKVVEGNYPTAKKNLQERKDKNQKSIDDYLKDPFKKQKDAKKKRQSAKQKRIKRNKEEKRRANKALAKSVLQNAKKSLVPILTLALTNQIAKIIAGNDRIGKLVRDTNNIITNANESGDPTKLNNAKIARDNAIRIIQNNEDKINKINTQIQRISVYINVFSIIVAIISAIPIPTSVPPGVGIPVSLIIKLVKILDKANQILLALSALIPIVVNVLDKAISILEDYKSQLLNINGQLESVASSGAEDTSGLLGNGGGIEFGTINETYKGFKFAIREDNGPNNKHVGQFKRHYAVAIDTNNVEVLKSEYSFTLDPNDLIEQLKLIIDQQNLIA
jgi:hypothetical protein